jgi:hypothetical protein
MWRSTASAFASADIARRVRTRTHCQVVGPCLQAVSKVSRGTGDQQAGGQLRRKTSPGSGNRAFSLPRRGHYFTLKFLENSTLLPSVVYVFSHRRPPPRRPPSPRPLRRRILPGVAAQWHPWRRSGRTPRPPGFRVNKVIFNSNFALPGNPRKSGEAYASTAD